MAEEKTGMGSWIKGIITSIFGLFSGAVLMYVSPLVNNAIKPGKPVANFAHQAQGLQVSFNNRSNGGTEGWWDFGDGSALVPYVAGQEMLNHTYPRPGVYTAKLSLRNFLGEENDRTISLQLESTGTATPVIEAFQVIPLKPDLTAPVTFRVVGKVKNADLCLWSLGEFRPLDVSLDTGSIQDRLVTITEAGNHTLRLVAVNGKQTTEKSETVWVNVGDSNAPEATLKVTYQAIHVNRLEKTHPIRVDFAGKGSETTSRFAMERPAMPGYKIQEVRFAKPVTASAVKNPKVEVAPDRTKFMLTGELVKVGTWSKNNPSPSWNVDVVSVQEMQSNPVARTMEPMVANLTVPGTVLLQIPPLPQGWVLKQRTMNLEIKDGNKMVWGGNQMPSNQVLQMKNRPWRVTATEVNGQLRLDVTDGKGLRPLAN